MIPAWRDAGAWSVLRIQGANVTLSVGAACRDTGAWGILEILGASGDLFVVFGAL